MQKFGHVMRDAAKNKADSASQFGDVFYELCEFVAFLRCVDALQKAINTRAQHAPETTLAIHIELASQPFAKVTNNVTRQPTPPQTMVLPKCPLAGQSRSPIKRRTVGL